MKKFVIVASIATLVLVISSCKKVGADEPTNTQQTQIQLLSLDPVIEEFSPLGETFIADDNYVPSLETCSDYIDIYLHIPDSGPYQGDTIEIYRYADEEEISEPCGAEFTLTKVPGENYVYCESPAKNCFEDEINGHCVLVFCDEP